MAICPIAADFYSAEVDSTESGIAAPF